MANMNELAPDLRHVPGFPPFAINVYVAGGVIVDAGTRYASRRILRTIKATNFPVTAHAVTHGHCDHQGSSAALTTALGVPLWAPAGEADAVRSGDLGPLGPVDLVTRWQLLVTGRAPRRSVARELREGDDGVVGFRVLETPGHSPGHLSYWRESDRVLIAGDVLFGRHPTTGRRGLHEPPTEFTLDPERNRASIRRVAALRPSLTVFGHGRPWRDTDALERFADALPS